jgi:hypothetical protein
MILKQSTNLCINSGYASFYTTAKKIRDGVGDDYYFNSAVQTALMSLEDSTTKMVKPTGIASAWLGFPIQLKIVE